MRIIEKKAAELTENEIAGLVENREGKGWTEERVAGLIKNRKDAVQL